MERKRRKMNGNYVKNFLVSLYQYSIFCVETIAMMAHI